MRARTIGCTQSARTPKRGNDERGERGHTRERTTREVRELGCSLAEGFLNTEGPSALSLTLSFSLPLFLLLSLSPSLSLSGSPSLVLSLSLTLCIFLTSLSLSLTFSISLFHSLSLSFLLSLALFSLLSVISGVLVGLPRCLYPRLFTTAGSHRLKGPTRFATWPLGSENTGRAGQE